MGDPSSAYSLILSSIFIENATLHKDSKNNYQSFNQNLTNKNGELFENFQFLQKSKYNCLNCDIDHTVYSSSHSLSISYQDCFKFKDFSNVSCSKCKRALETAKEKKIVKLPRFPVITIHEGSEKLIFNRNKFDLCGLLQMESVYEYQIKAVIKHQNSNHFVAFVNDNNEWTKYDDQDVSFVTGEVDFKQDQSVYMLFLEKIGNKNKKIDIFLTTNFLYQEQLDFHASKKKTRRFHNLGPSSPSHSPVENVENSLNVEKLPDFENYLNTFTNFDYIFPIETNGLNHQKLYCYFMKKKKNRKRKRNREFKKRN